MPVPNNYGSDDSLTQGWRAFQLFTDRNALIRTFLEYTHAEPPKDQVLFLHGEGGNGKSLLVRFLREYCCRYWGPDFTSTLQRLTYDQLIPGLKDPQALGPSDPIPYVYHDFAPDPISNESILSPDDVLRRLGADLSRPGFRFPLYTFATVRYLLQARRLPRDQIKSLLPKEEADLGMEVIDLLLAIPGIGVAKAALALLDKHFSPIQRLREWWTERVHRRNIDEAMVEQIVRMDPERELPNRLPELFADDLNEAMKLPNAPRRLVLFFDTHEAFWGGHRDRRGDQYYARDEWFRRLLNKLDYKAGIIAVVAGRELPHWGDKGVPIPISPELINPHRVGHLAPADALHYLERAGVTDAALRQTLVEYTSVTPGEVHPLYLGLAADVALAAQSGTGNLASEDFATNDVMDSKKVELVNRFRRYVDDELVYATDALAACRAFDRELFTYLGEQLNFQHTEPIFRRLLTFSFVWQDGRHGAGWYRIHDLIRRIFQERHDPTTLRAHQALEAYYRQRAKTGDPTAIAEAIYHANHIDWERGVREWIQEFDKALEYSLYELCRALLNVRTELVIITDFWKGRVSRGEGDYYAILSRHDQALEEYTGSISSYDAVLKMAPDDVAVIGNKGLVLQALGDLQAGLAQHEQAQESYRLSISSYDAALSLAPNDVFTLNNKGIVLQSLGTLQAGLTQHEQAQQSYRLSISSYDVALKVAPADVFTLNNKGNVLQELGALQAGLAQHEQAQESYKLSISSYDAVLSLVPDYVYALRNKGIALTQHGDLLTFLNHPDEACDNFSLALTSFEHALRIAPNNKSTQAAISRLQERIRQCEEQASSSPSPPGAE
ncbi:MAG TPA: hypothetical protein VGE04_06410 [Chloroflexia bacterium]|jgi:tetratricopeptide (TPR) repeat protein